MFFFLKFWIRNRFLSIKIEFHSSNQDWKFSHTIPGHCIHELVKDRVADPDPMFFFVILDPEPLSFDED